MSHERDFRWLPFQIAKAIQQAALGDREEEELLAEALKRGRANPSSHPLLTLDFNPLQNICFNLSDGLTGGAFRRQHMLVQNEILMRARDLAFGAMPDVVREENSRFCELMYRGHQQRFLNRHPGEDPEDFLDRARKRTLNLTRRIIDIKSMLYLERPVREVKDTEPESVGEALSEIWSDAYDQVMLECDRFTRLLGVTSIRPIFDEESKGKIRLWMFMNHQLRVIPDPLKPWKPCAVIERHNPFNSQGQIVIWTNKSFLQVAGTKARGSPHGLGRIPHTFFRPCMTFSSFFVEGEGKSLCDANAVFNDKYSDLNEIIQLQGFSIAELINPDNEDESLSPRSAFVFSVPDNQTPFGVNFKSPDAPLADLREDLVRDLEDILLAHGVASETLGSFRTRGGLSGVAIRLLLQPIRDENMLTARAFSPQEVDLADSCLRVRAAHDETFSYEPDGCLDISIRHRLPELPVDARDQVARDELDFKTGVTTPAEVIQRRDPARFPTLEEAEEKWRENLRKMREAGLSEVLEARDPAATVERLDSEDAQLELEGHRLKELELHEPANHPGGRNGIPRELNGRGS